MTVKASVSISDQQEIFARQLVEDGRYSSLSAVVQRGLELLREETELKEAELQALRGLISKRRAGEFLTREESRQHLEDIISETRKSYGL
ncbi:type II toxin-antitoxin system ParD family antitoxin [Rhizobium sp. TH2]|uniref:type II toxin-antitoxin system ParD family antitoxin n=1 Tax=Rhizobium sp. TH2 TaxID=2775403 RepID=UPI0021588A9D|nr:type II toxin-antitoxin system ParD family antitoxin [Rhizobium sp. TH2]UVC08711.1 type II toxin-antitoxin system ParD family antitoxin [Rhizobium sp. TH2]